jgi:hypothetical protein
VMFLVSLTCLVALDRIISFFPLKRRQA